MGKDVKISFDVAKLQQHHCERAVLNCVDWRFRRESQELIERRFGPDFDYYAYPGGAKNFATETLVGSEFIKAIERVSIGLHEAKKLLILCHWDCGAYGGSRAFQSAEAEEQAYIRDLTAAQKVFQRELPQLTVEIGYTKVVDGELVLRVM